MPHLTNNVNKTYKSAEEHVEISLLIEIKNIIVICVSEALLKE